MTSKHGNEAYHGNPLVTMVASIAAMLWRHKIVMRSTLFYFKFSNFGTTETLVALPPVLAHKETGKILGRWRIFIGGQMRLNSATYPSDAHSEHRGEEQDVRDAVKDAGDGHRLPAHRSTLHWPTAVAAVHRNARKKRPIRLTAVHSSHSPTLLFSGRPMKSTARTISSLRWARFGRARSWTLTGYEILSATYNSTRYPSICHLLNNTVAVTSSPVMKSA